MATFDNIWFQPNTLFDLFAELYLQSALVSQVNRQLLRDVWFTTTAVELNRPFCQHLYQFCSRSCKWVCPATDEMLACGTQFFPCKRMRGPIRKLTS